MVLLPPSSIRRDGWQVDRAVGHAAVRVTKHAVVRFHLAKLLRGHPIAFPFDVSTVAGDSLRAGARTQVSYFLFAYQVGNPAGGFG